MPMVGSKLFPYSQEGMKAAEKYAKENNMENYKNRGGAPLDKGAYPYRATKSPKIAPASYSVEGPGSGYLKTSSGGSTAPSFTGFTKKSRSEGMSQAVVSGAKAKKGK